MVSSLQRDLVKEQVSAAVDAGAKALFQVRACLNERTCVCGAAVAVGVSPLIHFCPRRVRHLKVMLGTGCPSQC